MNSIYVILAGMLMSMGCGAAQVPATPHTVANTSVCSSSPEVSAHLEGIMRRLEAIENRLASIQAQRNEPSAPPVAEPKRPARPQPDVVYAMPVDGSPMVGAKDAKVTIVKAFEFWCPYCKKAFFTVEELRRIYGTEIRVVYKHVLVHSQARKSALAACAAGLQGKFDDIQKAFWKATDEFGKAGFSWAPQRLDDERVIRIAQDVGLNMDRFKTDLKETCSRILALDRRVMRHFGVRGTPGFFINGRFLAGAQPLDKFRLVIDEELEKANERIKKGAQASSYYEEWVMKKGQPSL